MIGKLQPAVSTTKAPLEEKAMMKVNRYTAGGNTQSQGKLATSVERCWVTPSIKLAGTKA